MVRIEVEIAFEGEDEETALGQLLTCLRGTGRTRQSVADAIALASGRKFTAAMLRNVETGRVSVKARTLEMLLDFYSDRISDEGKQVIREIYQGRNR